MPITQRPRGPRAATSSSSSMPADGRRQPSSKATCGRRAWMPSPLALRLTCLAGRTTWGCMRRHTCTPMCVVLLLVRAGGSCHGGVSRRRHLAVGWPATPGGPRSHYRAAALPRGRSREAQSRRRVALMGPSCPHGSGGMAALPMLQPLCLRADTGASPPPLPPPPPATRPCPPTPSQAWRAVDRAYVDKSFNGQSWFKVRSRSLQAGRGVASGGSVNCAGAPRAPLQLSCASRA